MSITYHITQEEMEQMIDRYFQEVHNMEVVWDYDLENPISSTGGLNIEVFSEVAVQHDGISYPDDSIWDDNDFLNLSEGDYEAVREALEDLGKGKW